MDGLGLQKSPELTTYLQLLVALPQQALEVVWVPERLPTTIVT